MLPPEIRYVVGIDVAKSAQVVCALEVPSGTVRLKSTPIPATADGHAHLIRWLQEWAAAAEHPAAVLIGLESTGSLWEPLYDALSPRGLRRGAAQPAPDGVVGGQLGAAGQDRWHRRPHPGAWPAGWLGTGEQGARRDGTSPADVDAHPP